MAGTKNNY